MYLPGQLWGGEHFIMHKQEVYNPAKYYLCVCGRCQSSGTCGAASPPAEGECCVVWRTLPAPSPTTIKTFCIVFLYIL